MKNRGTGLYCRYSRGKSSSWRKSRTVRGRTISSWRDTCVNDPVYRKTPLGREIADLLLAVNRPYGKSDYIPCICWGRNARYASGFEVGEHVRILGRIQSREYVKKLSETETETRTAYEVSVSKLECMDE